MIYNKYKPWGRLSGKKPEKKFFATLNFSINFWRVAESVSYRSLTEEGRRGVSERHVAPFYRFMYGLLRSDQPPFPRARAAAFLA